MADYAKVNQIEMEPAFDWWVPTVLWQRNCIIKRAANHHHCIGYKFGIPLPSSVADAERSDMLHGNTLWMDALQKEMEAAKLLLRFKMPKSNTFPDTKRYLDT